MLPHYKHAASVTGQVFYCAAPIRLDAYDGCQFGCVYCFSRKRARLWADNGVHGANTKAFAERMRRVAEGEIASALDEFLQARVPIQLGGLQDPFTAREKVHGTTKKLMHVLRDFEYPTLISTKADILMEPDYLSLLREMNVVVRFSAAGVAERFRPEIDKGCSTFDQTIEKIERLSSLHMPTGLRLQPVIPGFEDHALRMAERAASVGVNQISFEYLKIPQETLKVTTRLLKDATTVDVVALMKARGLTRVGWDYTMTADAKRQFVCAARATCRRAGVRFGAGDTEYIPWSDGDGCCGSTGLFLKQATQFNANLVGSIKDALNRADHQLTFKHLKSKWSPIKPISTYLSSKSRPRTTNPFLSDWNTLLAERWNGAIGPYSPEFFEGVRWTGECDAEGLRIYDVGMLAAALAI